MCGVFFFNDTATTEIYTLSLHDALPISPAPDRTGPARTVSGPVSATDTHNCVRSRRSQVNSVAVPNLQRVRPGGAMPVGAVHPRPSGSRAHGPDRALPGHVP